MIDDVEWGNIIKVGVGRSVSPETLQNNHILIKDFGLGSDIDPLRLTVCQNLSASYDHYTQKLILASTDGFSVGLNVSQLDRIGDIKLHKADDRRYAMSLPAEKQSAYLIIFPSVSQPLKGNKKDQPTLKDFTVSMVQAVGEVLETRYPGINQILKGNLDLRNPGDAFTILCRQAAFCEKQHQLTDPPQFAAELATGKKVPDIDTWISHGMRLGQYTDWAVPKIQIKLLTDERPLEIKDTKQDVAGNGAGDAATIKDRERLKVELNDLEMTTREIEYTSKTIRRIEKSYRSYLQGENRSFPPNLKKLAADLDTLTEIIANPRSAENTIQLPTEAQMKNENIDEGRLFTHYSSEFRAQEAIPTDHAATLREESVRLASVLFRRMVWFCKDTEATPANFHASRMQLLFDHAPLRALVDQEAGQPLMGTDQAHYFDLFSAYWELFPNFGSLLHRWLPSSHAGFFADYFTHTPNQWMTAYAEFLETLAQSGDPLLRAPYPDRSNTHSIWGMKLYDQYIVPDSPIEEVLPVVTNLMRIILINQAKHASTPWRYDYQSPDAQRKLIKRYNSYTSEVEKCMKKLLQTLHEMSRGKAQSVIDAIISMRVSRGSDDLNPTPLSTMVGEIEMTNSKGNIVELLEDGLDNLV